MTQPQAAVTSARPGQQSAETKPQTADEKKIAKKMRSKKLAEKRTGRVLEAIRLLGNLGSVNYALSADEKKHIVDALSNATAELEGRFEQSYTADKQSWHFPA